MKDILPFIKIYEMESQYFEYCRSVKNLFFFNIKPIFVKYRRFKDKKYIDTTNQLLHIPKTATSNLFNGFL